MRTQTQRRLRLLLILPALASFGCQYTQQPTSPGDGSLSVTDSDQESTLEGPNVIKYDHLYVLADSRIFIRQGTRLPGGGCEFATETILAPGESITELEIAFDPDTCRSLNEAGKSPPRET